MELRELTVYAKEKYGVTESRLWSDFPGFSVLAHPRTGKWVALLMRQWDGDLGEEVQRCDLKCEKLTYREAGKPYLSPPLRMKGNKWIGVNFTSQTEPEVIFSLLDRAMAAEEPRGALFVLDNRPTPAKTVYQDTPLPVSPQNPPLPEQLRQLRRMFRYGARSSELDARSFYQQARFMESYQDDTPWEGGFVHYYPTYQDLTTQQLRGYFTWRTRLRQGEFTPIPVACAHLYAFELLNGVGASSPEDTLHKLDQLQGFLYPGTDFWRADKKLALWKLEFAVVKGLPAETAQACLEPKLLAWDQALCALREPEQHSHEEVFSALCRLGGDKLAQSPAATQEGQRLFSQAWKAALGYRWQGKDLFALCFGEPAARSWYPLSLTLYYWQERQKDRVYTLDPCRSYRCQGGMWKTVSYETSRFDKSRFQGFLHEAQRLLRLHLKVGRPLKAQPADAWATPYISQAIQEAARPKLTIDLSGLDRIRREAVTTRDSLLIDQEEEEPETPIPEETAPSSLDGFQVRVLRLLLAGSSPDGLLREQHRMPSLVADEINEALMDEIGDTVVLCEGDRLLLVEDYLTELTQLLGGT